MKIFLTGASGMLAMEIIRKLKEDGHELILTDAKPRLDEIEPLDITSQVDIYRQIKETAPDYVFHLAAETNVDLCERQPDHAYKVNTLGTETIALVCQQENIRLLYISTAGVFDGKKETPYNEFDTPNPINHYGKSKLQGEHMIRNLLNRYFIIRAGWMVGGWEIDKKFVYKIIRQIQEGSRELRVVSDKLGSPTFTKDFADNLKNIINTNRYGLYHMTNKGYCSRYEMALKIVEYMGKKDEVTIHSISSNDFPLDARRADSEMIDNYKLDLLGINHMPPWDDSLRSYIQENIHKQGSSQIEQTR